jgi:hypothetical protein
MNREAVSCRGKSPLPGLLLSASMALARSDRLLLAGA